MTEIEPLKPIIEGALMAAGRPLTLQQIADLFEEEQRPAITVLRDAVTALQADCEGRGVELKQVASGFRYQVIQDVAPWVGRLWEEKPQRYSRALMETLALIVYRQPITRGDIEEIRGVAVSSQIIKTLVERDWVRVVGHKDVPGRPAMYASTRRFLDYFNLRNLDELPTLAELKDLDSLNAELELGEEGEQIKVALPEGLEIPSGDEMDADQHSETTVSGLEGEASDRDDSFDHDEFSEVDQSEYGVETIAGTNESLDTPIYDNADNHYADEDDIAASVEPSANPDQVDREPNEDTEPQNESDEADKS